LGALAAGLTCLIDRRRSCSRSLDRFLDHRFAAGNALLIDSGTNALALALSAVARSHDRPLIAMPAYGCFDVATAAEAADVSVVLYDLEPSTLGPDWESYRAALRQGACAAVIVHLYGVPVDIAKAAALAEEHGVPLIEDAAQGSGATYRRRYLGSFGSLSVLSFGRGKGITGGSGGAVFSTDDRGAGLLDSLSPELGPALAGLTDLAMCAATWLLARPSVYELPASLPFLQLGETTYKVPSAARQMTRVAQGVLERTLDLVEGEEETRRANGRRIARMAMEGSAFRSVSPPPDADPGFLRLPLLASSPEAAAAARSKLAQRLGVLSGYPAELSELAPLRPRLANPAADHTGARELVESLFTAPTHGRLTRDDVDALLVWIRDPTGQDGLR
jgi:perosamine synthetase